MSGQNSSGFGARVADGVRFVSTVLLWMSSAAIVFIVLITCTEIVLRMFKITLTGTFDLVQVAGAVAIACALPYTTAAKGHVAIELLFQKLGRRGRAVVDTMARSVGIVFFAVLAWQSVKYGNSLRESGQVTPTLQLPVFWLAWLIGFCCAVTVMVKIYHLFHPGKEMIKP